AGGDDRTVRQEVYTTVRPWGPASGSDLLLLGGRGGFRGGRTADEQRRDEDEHPDASGDDERGVQTDGVGADAVRRAAEGGDRDEDGRAERAGDLLQCGDDGAAVGVQVVG